jgi:hypothetical protein
MNSTIYNIHDKSYVRGASYVISHPTCYIWCVYLFGELYYYTITTTTTTTTTTITHFCFQFFNFLFKSLSLSAASYPNPRHRFIRVTHCIQIPALYITAIIFIYDKSYVRGTWYVLSHPTCYIWRVCIFVGGFVVD